jgi:uncharacterized damage-inducible protein DinB
MTQKLSLGNKYWQELQLEAAVTRRFLEKVPMDHWAYQPHPSSESLGRLAIHVAEIIAWWKACVEQDALDFIDFEPQQIQTNHELLDYFDALLEEAKHALLNVHDEEFEKEWSMKHGDEILFTLPKDQVARIFCMNHLVHHRAQLGMYLRLLGVAVPATYGPSADDEDVILIQRF